MERFKVVKSENSKSKNAKAKKTYGSTKYEEVKTGAQADLLELRSLGVEQASSLTTGKSRLFIIYSAKCNVKFHMIR